MRYIATLILYFAFVVIVSAQATKPIVDTVPIYKNKSGVRYGIYKRIWFFRPGKFSYWNTENKQDSIVIESSTQPHYLKVYDSQNRLIMEGKSGLDGMLEGDIKFYYQNGRVKRIEHWGNDAHIDTCNIKFDLYDAPGHEGTWSYYKRDGTLKMRDDFEFINVNCQTQDFSFARRRTRLSKSGKIRSVGFKVIEKK